MVTLIGIRHYGEGVNLSYGGKVYEEIQQNVNDVYGSLFSIGIITC